MKSVRALLLVLALSVCAYAGNMPNGLTDTPPPPAPSSTPAESEGDTGNISGQTEAGGTSTESIAEVTLTLLQSVLALF